MSNSDAASIMITDSEDLEILGLEATMDREDIESIEQFKSSMIAQAEELFELLLLTDSERSSRSGDASYSFDLDCKKIENIARIIENIKVEKNEKPKYGIKIVEIPEDEELPEADTKNLDKTVSETSIPTNDGQTIIEEIIETKKKRLDENPKDVFRKIKINKVAFKGIKTQLITVAFDTTIGEIGIGFMKYKQGYFVTDIKTNSQADKLGVIYCGMLIYEILTGTQRICGPTSQSVVNELLPCVKSGKPLLFKFLMMTPELQAMDRGLIPQKVMREQKKPRDSPIISFLSGFFKSTPPTSASKI